MDLHTAQALRTFRTVLPGNPWPWLVMGFALALALVGCSEGGVGGSGSADPVTTDGEEGGTGGGGGGGGGSPTGGTVTLITRN